MEPFSETEIEDTSSVNQGGTRRPVPHANPVASPGEEAGPSNRIPPVRPYPYQENEIMGGSSKRGKPPCGTLRGEKPFPLIFGLPTRPYSSRGPFRGQGWDYPTHGGPWPNGRLDGTGSSSSRKFPPRERSPWIGSMPYWRTCRGAEYNLLHISN